jgi:glycosyltransferase involved in cell wall biosynthesis
VDKKEPIRVLQIVGRMDRGGIENFIMNNYRNIDRDKVQFDFLCHYGREAAFNDEIRSMGGRIYEMPAIRDETHVYYWKLFEYIRALNKFFEEHKEYRIIHGEMTNTAAIYMPIAKKHGVTTRIAHSHNSHGKVGLLGIITNILKKPVYKYATDLFACSKAAAKYLYPESYINAGKVMIIPNAVDANKFRYNPEKRNQMRVEFGVKDKLVIGCVGRFRTEKNQQYLLGVLQKALEIEPNAVLLFAGDGPQEESVKQKAAEMGIADKCVFLGMRSDIQNVMQAIDVLAMPSLFEGLPVTGIEAQASGLYVVASTGVPDEMNVIDLVDFIPLEDGETRWAQKLISRAKTERIDTYDKIKSAGYDIHATAQWLQEFYLKRG